MTITEESRHALYQRLETALGHEEATTLMEMLPPVGWADVATKRDLDHLNALMRSDLRGEMQALGTELRSEMQALGTELRSEMHALGTDLRGELHAALASNLRWTLGVNATFATLLFGAIKLL